MKLLFDENLSPKLARRLADLFPNSTHVRDVGLKTADDPLVAVHEIAAGMRMPERTATIPVAHLA